MLVAGSPFLVLKMAAKNVVYLLLIFHIIQVYRFLFLILVPITGTKIRRKSKIDTIQSYACTFRSAV